MEQKPSIGRIVHYVWPENGKMLCRAAIISEVVDNDAAGRVSVAVMFPRGQAFYEDVLYHTEIVEANTDCPDAATHGNPFRYCGTCNWTEDGRTPHTWRWPERV